MIPEIITLIALVAVVVGAVRRRRRRSRGRTVYLPFDVDQALTTAADNGVFAVALQTLTQDFDIFGVRGSVTFAGITPGDSPIEVGWADNNLTAAEILEQRDAAPTSQWDIPATEHQKRKVRVFGTSGGPGVTSGSYSLNDGQYIWKKMFLHVPAGKALADIWMINRSGQQLTTGQIVTVTGDVIGRWK